MKKQTFLLLLLIPLQVLTQEFLTNYKSWEDGPLTWDDFKGKPLYNQNFPSDFDFILGFQTEKIRLHDTTLINFKANAVFIRDGSWVNPSAKSDINLLFNQVIFNVIELYRRKMQIEMNTVQFSFQANGYLDHYYKKIHQEIYDLQNLMSQGNFTYALQKKNSEVLSDLENSRQDAFPPVRRSAFGMGMHAGFGFGLLTGSLGNHFQTSKNILFGFDFGYRNLVLYLTGSLNYSSVIENYEERNHWEKGLRTGIAIMESSLGYNLVDGSKFKVAPFAGISLIEVSNREIKDDSVNDFRMVNYYRLIGGINLDYKWRKRFNLYPKASSFKEYVETDIRLRLYILSANYYSDLKGYSINLTIGMNGFMNFLRLNN